jgi:hypothetical protein
MVEAIAKRGPKGVPEPLARVIEACLVLSRRGGTPGARLFPSTRGLRFSAGSLNRK